jgi:predicted nuclease of predicted toxin-antitoxin system
VSLLDHNIPEHQVALLRQARVQPQQIGRDVGRPERQDFEEILRYLHRRKASTFISRDKDFFIVVFVILSIALLSSVDS